MLLICSSVFQVIVPSVYPLQKSWMCGHCPVVGSFSLQRCLTPSIFIFLLLWNMGIIIQMATHFGLWTTVGSLHHMLLTRGNLNGWAVEIRVPNYSWMWSSCCFSVSRGPYLLSEPARGLKYEGKKPWTCINYFSLSSLKQYRIIIVIPHLHCIKYCQTI